MSDATVGDLARFLEANPGWHRVGDHMVKHITTINDIAWTDQSDGSESSEPS